MSAWLMVDSKLKALGQAAIPHEYFPVTDVQHIIRYIAEKRGCSMDRAREIWLEAIGNAELTGKRKRPRPEPIPQVTHRDPKLTTR